jgi:hypothetical protein
MLGYSSGEGILASAGQEACIHCPLRASGLHSSFIRHRQGSNILLDHRLLPILTSAVDSLDTVCVHGCELPQAVHRITVVVFAVHGARMPVR